MKPPYRRADGQKEARRRMFAGAAAAPFLLIGILVTIGLWSAAGLDEVLPDWVLILIVTAVTVAVGLRIELRMGRRHRS